MNTEPVTNTSGAAPSRWVTMGRWNGIEVPVESDEFCPLALQGHDLSQMHHYGNPDGKDYGPTGFLFCSECGGVAVEPASMEEEK